MLQVGENENTTKTRASYRSVLLLGEGVCERRESVSARLGACGGREGGRPASATHSFMTSISRRLLGEHMVSSRFRFRFSSRFACFVGRGASRRADGNLGGHGPPQRPKNGRAELPPGRALWARPVGLEAMYILLGPACRFAAASCRSRRISSFFWGGGGGRAVFFVPKFVKIKSLWPSGLRRCVQVAFIY